MEVLPGPTAPPAPQRPAYAQARIDHSQYDLSQLHKGAIPPHSLVYNTNTELGKRPQDRLEPVLACGAAFQLENHPFGVVQDSMLDLKAIKRHEGHRHVGVCVQGLVTIACNNKDLVNAEVGDFLVLEGPGQHTYHGAPEHFKGLKFTTVKSLEEAPDIENVVGKIYGFSTTRANEVEVLLR